MRDGFSIGTLRAFNQRRKHIGAIGGPRPEILKNYLSNLSFFLVLKDYKVGPSK